MKKILKFSAILLTLLAILSCFGVMADDGDTVEKDGVFLGVIGKTAYFSPITSREERLEMRDILLSLYGRMSESSRITRLKIGEATVDIEYRPKEAYRYRGNVPIYVTSVSAYGFTLPIEYGVCISDDEYFERRFIQTDEFFAFMLTYDTRVSGKYWVFSMEGASEIKDDYVHYGNDWYNSARTVLTVDGGALTYVRRPFKFTYSVNFGEYLKYCVSRDEFAEESGHVAFENGEAVLIPDSVRTAEEVFDIDGDFKKIKGSRDGVVIIGNRTWNVADVPTSDTVDGLLAENANTLIRAEAAK